MASGLSAFDLSEAVLPAVPASVVHLLASAAEDHPSAPAVQFEGLRLNYAQFAAAVAGLARHWRRRVPVGARVALILQNTLDLALATYALHSLRAQVVPLNPRYSARELGVLLADAQPALIVHDERVEAGFPAPAGVPVVAARGGRAFADLAAQNDRLPSDLPGHDDLATLQYTGGTTGVPKGVNISHRHLAFNLAQREALLPTRYADEVMLCTMPLFHVSAVAMCLHLSAYCAGELVIHRRFDAGALLQAVADHRVTLISGAPTVYYSLVEHPTLHRVDLASLRACYSGAAALPEPILQRWEAAAGCPLLEGYGLSEAGPCLTYNPLDGAHKPGSVGRPVPGSAMQIVDTTRGTTVLPVGQVGEIRVRGPHVMTGYRNRPEQNREVLREGWFYTGDLAQCDADGYIAIKGRRHETINVGGFNVYPREVEAVLLEHPQVLQAAAFAVPHPRYGQVVQAWVVPRPGAALDPDRLAAHCAASLVAYKVPHAIGLTDALPLTGVGKLARASLQPVRCYHDRGVPTANDKGAT